LDPPSTTLAEFCLGATWRLWTSCSRKSCLLWPVRGDWPKNMWIQYSLWMQYIMH
jgi:hypothetical protein